MRTMPEVGRDEVLTQFQIQYVDARIVKAMGELVVGRKLFAPRSIGSPGKKVYTYYTETDMGPAIISMTGTVQGDDKSMYDDNDVKVPVIHKSFEIPWRDIQAALTEGPSLLDQYAANAAKQIVEEEDKLFVTGQYTGWAAYDIQGLATRTGRCTNVGGAWPTNAYANINAGRALLEAAGFYDEPILVGTPTIIKYLDSLIANTGITYRKSLLENEIVADIMETTSLYTAAGAQTNALLVVPNEEYLYYVEGQPPVTTYWYDKMGTAHGLVREVVAPVIARPGCVCEITGLSYG